MVILKKILSISYELYFFLPSIFNLTFILLSSYNTRKFIELPYHSFKIDEKEYETSQYLTNLTWIHDKINSTGCVQLLLDIYLISHNLNLQLSEHLQFLVKFLQLSFKSLNYDAQQIYSLLITYINVESAKHSNIASNTLVQSWKKEIEDQKLLRIEKVDPLQQERINDKIQNSCDDNKNGYDFLINSNRDENFVISLSTDREEICVWNILK